MPDERDKLVDVLDYWTPLTLRLCADAGVLEAFGREERSIAEVAAVTAVHAGTLRRMVRLLASREVFEGRGEDRFRLGRLGLLLLADEPGNLAGLLNFPPPYFHAWAQARHTMRTGRAVVRGSPRPGDVRLVGRASVGGLRLQRRHAAPDHDACSKVRSRCTTGPTTG